MAAGPRGEERLLSQFAAAALRKAILEGEFAPGARLRQDELIARFDVSSAPLREALRSLEAEGLVEHRANRGVYVLVLSPEEMLGVVAPTRVILEEYAIGHALAESRDAYLAELRTSLERMQEAAARGDLHAVNSADVAFHQVAIDICDQPHTTQLWRSVMPRLHAAFARLAPRAQSLQEIVQEHLDLFEAIEGGVKSEISAELHTHAIVKIETRLGEEASHTETA